jgi:hypothetical protein
MTDTQAVILRVLKELGRPVHTTKLVKLVYLVDYLYYQQFGRTLTGFQYMWDHYGPNALGHGIAAEAGKLAQKGMVRCVSYENVYGGVASDYSLAPGAEISSLNPEAEVIIRDIVKQYGKLSVPAITAAAKRTAPFREAAQYSLLKMNRTSKPETAKKEDVDLFDQALHELGTISLEELRKKYAV